ncbi:MAG: hypothetical protein AAGJ28_19670 [Pseudomonadota bacterium]
MRFPTKLLSILTIFALGACADSSGTGGGAARPDVAATKAEFQARATAFQARTEDGPGILAGALVGRVLSIPANDIQQRFTPNLSTERNAHKPWEYLEVLLDVDGSSGYRLYRVGLRGIQTPLRLDRFSDPWKIGLDGRQYWLAKPRSLTPDADGWVWSEWHHDPREPGALYTGTKRRAKFDTNAIVQLRPVYPSIFASRRKSMAAIRKQLLVGTAATGFAQQQTGDAQRRLAALGQASEANADYKAFQKRIELDERGLRRWMAVKDCSQPNAPFDKYDSAKNSYNQGRAHEAEARCMMERSAAWDPEPWITAHAGLATQEAALFAKTAEVKRVPVPDAASLYAGADARITKVWDRANSEYADAKKYAREERIAAERREAAHAAAVRRVAALNAAINNILRVPGAANRYRRTTTGSGSTSYSGSITLTERRACPGSGQKQTRWGCMTDAEYSAEQARLSDHDAKYQAYLDNQTAIRGRGPIKADVVNKPAETAGSRTK